MQIIILLINTHSLTLHFKASLEHLTLSLVMIAHIHECLHVFCHIYQRYFYCHHSLAVVLEDEGDRVEVLFNVFIPGSL